MIQILKTNQVLSVSSKYFEIGRHYWFTWKKFIKPNNCTSVKYVVVLNLKVKFYWIHTLHQFIKNIFLVIFVIGKAFSMTIWQNIWKRVMIKSNVINAIINSRGEVGYNWFSNQILKSFFISCQIIWNCFLWRVFFILIHLCFHKNDDLI